MEKTNNIKKMNYPEFALSEIEANKNDSTKGVDISFKAGILKDASWGEKFILAGNQEAIYITDASMRQGRRTVTYHMVAIYGQPVLYPYDDNGKFIQDPEMVHMNIARRYSENPEEVETDEDTKTEEFTSPYTPVPIEPKVEFKDWDDYFARFASGAPL